MFKRAIWTGVGFGMGLGSSWWVKRALSRRVQRYVPARVRRHAATRARRVGTEVSAAVREGRHAMRQYRDDAEREILDIREPPGRPNLRAVNDN